MPSWTIATHDFTLRLNEDWNEDWTFEYPDQTRLDLTDRELIMEIRAAPESLEVAMTASTDNSRIEVLDAANGIARFNVPQAVIETLPAGDWVYDLRLDGAASREVLVTGKITIERGITRAENEVA